MTRHSRTAPASGRRRTNPATIRRSGARRPTRPSLRDRLQAAADSRQSRVLLAAVAYTESFAFLIPPDVLLIPMVIARPERWIRLAVLTTLASVVGALTGYAIGALAYDALGRPLLEYYGFTDHFESFASDISQYGAWAVIIAGVTPFPFKVATILAGATGLNVAIFLASCAAARGVRYATVAWIVQRAGPAAAAAMERRLGWVAATLTVAALCVMLALLLLP